MFFARVVSVLIMVTGTCQRAAKECQGMQYYNKEVNECCFRCPQGQVTSSTCVKNTHKECGTCSEPNNFIIWSQKGPKCATCRSCRKESKLVEIQKCSLLTEAICQCEPGYYCETVMDSSCARCNPFTQCPPGKGVKRKGTSERDTECEVCRSTTFSNVYSATEACQPHTDCNKLHKVTAQRGNATADAVCGQPKNPAVIPSENNTPRQNMTYPKYATTSAATTPDTTIPPTTTSETSTVTTSGAAGEWSMVYVVAAIICVISLLVAFLLYWTQKICNLKLWKYFIQPELSGRTVITMEDNNKENVLQKENITLETYQRIENTQSDWKISKHEMHQGRDQMNNRIENIYIMNADTVLVGSVSEVPTHCRSAATECDNADSPLLVSRYPQQESSKCSTNDLMFSIEEEERESCAAKAMLEV
ncbi:tumor necrosis factor receptor superfamily member 1B-like [Eleutherodactylus coqui]|uniref:tumor necrosis factor receptor superfamily member 1B-like n=1 Tax=Eleutherodactylus coqui TaxID=57060 RepID=UPI003462C29C